MANAIIVYDTVYNNTEIMAQEIEKGLKEAGVKVVVKKALDAKVDELKDFDAVVLGCPTYYDDLISSIKWFLTEMRKVDLKGKVGAVFGSYGWKAVLEHIYAPMKNIFGMEMVDPILKKKMTELITDEAKRDCREFGKKIAAKLK
ncbi:MAG: nitric oxide synthase [Methanophagales archaeon ANME-1-THS]|nr:MAG: nitric oxide synthase [Methanophagales archaeon ANME-1-THS]